MPPAQAELVDIEPGIIPVEQAERHILAEKSWDDIDSHVEGGLLGPFHDPPAVLRSAALGDVHAGDRLNVVDDPLALFGGEMRYRPEQAVVSHLDHEVLFVGRDE